MPGADQSCGVGKSAKHHEGQEDGEVRASAEPPDAGAGTVVPEVAAGRSGHYADVGMWAGVDAVEAEGAVHVARFARLEQVQFASGNPVPAADAILGPACRADLRVPDLHFQRRHQRLHEVELADGANAFAEPPAPQATAPTTGHP